MNMGEFLCKLHADMLKKASDQEDHPTDPFLHSGRTCSQCGNTAQVIRLTIKKLEKKLLKK